MTNETEESDSSAVCRPPPNLNGELIWLSLRYTRIPLDMVVTKWSGFNNF